MPSESVASDPTAALGAALAPLAVTAGQGADDVLDLRPVAGERETQVALDAYLEQVADLLREVQASADELVATLRVAARARPTRPGGIPADERTRSR